MRRWWMTGPGEPDNSYTVKVWLVCGICKTEMCKCGHAGGYTCGTLRGIVDHCRNEHALDFVSVQAFENQTRQWFNEWNLTTEAGPVFWMAPARSIYSLKNGLRRWRI